MSGRRTPGGSSAPLLRGSPDAEWGCGTAGVRPPLQCPDLPPGSWERQTPARHAALTVSLSVDFGSDDEEQSGVVFPCTTESLTFSNRFSQCVSFMKALMIWV